MRVVGEWRGKGREVAHLLLHAPWLLEVLQSSKLGKLHENDLTEEDGVGVAPVRESLGQRPNHAGLVPNEAGGLGNDADLAQELRRDAASGAEHGVSSVDDLGVPEPVLGDDSALALGVVDAERVEAVVAGKGAVEVREGLLASEPDPGLLDAVDLSKALLLGLDDGGNLGGLKTPARVLRLDVLGRGLGGLGLDDFFLLGLGRSGLDGPPSSDVKRGPESEDLAGGGEKARRRARARERERERERERMRATTGEVVVTSASFLLSCEDARGEGGERAGDPR